MFIIFDLDDTLIDTSGSIFPSLLKHALKVMQGRGLIVKSQKRAYAELVRLNTFRTNARDALEEFLEINQAPPDLFDVGVEAIYENPRFNGQIFPVQGAIDMLREFSTKFQLVLVTRGKEGVQCEKMRRAGISTNLFTHLYFCSHENKQIVYQKVGEELGISPSKSFVCGDRIALDLAPAKALGYNTVHVRWGRGLGDTGLRKDVDYSVVHLMELKTLIGRITNSWSM